MADDENPQQQPPPPTGQQQPPPYGQYPAQQGGNGLAVAGMVLGILATFFGIIFITFFLAIPLGVIALALSIPAILKARRTGARKGMAIAGIVLGAIGLILGIVGAATLNSAVNNINDAIERIEEVPPDTIGDTTTTRAATEETTKVGETLTLDDGAKATVYSVTPNSPAPNDFVTPTAGSTFTGVDLEQCAGSESLPVNPLYWRVQTTDNREDDAVLGAQDFQTGDLAANQCRRGSVLFEVPDGQTVKAVILTDVLLGETARWTAS